MNNLSKENFWNPLYDKYPKGMKVFCDWIDEYKKENNWTTLFNGHTGWDAPKYHDLPMAMQVGIWIEFVQERGGCQWEIEDMLDIDWEEEIEGFIKEINSQETVSA